MSDVARSGFDDVRGLRVTASGASAVRHLDDAIAAWARHRRVASAALASALDADPDLALGRILEGFWTALLGRRDKQELVLVALARARASIAQRGGTPREVWLADALEAWSRGDPPRAIDAVERVAALGPDLAAAKLSHALRFVVGDVRGMRESAERAAERFDRSLLGSANVLGMLAFSLEESGELARAERIGRDASTLDANDLWAIHAVAHVMEMQGRTHEGDAWLTAHAGALEGATNFAGHVAWHHTLFELGLGRGDAVLARYDAMVAPHLASATLDYRDIANATSLLFRLERHGVAVGDRWLRLADLAESMTGDHGLSFADVHYGLALVGSGRIDEAARFVRSMRVSLSQVESPHTRALVDDVGLPLAEAILALGRGDPARAASLLVRTRPDWQRLGGSHAQRDTLELLLLHASLAAGRMGVARDLVAARERSGRRERWAVAALAS